VGNLFRITKTGLQSIMAISSLTSLNLGGLITIKEEDFMGISHLTNLTKLVLAWCPGLTDDTVTKVLGSLPCLSDLDVSSCRGLTPNCLTFLQGLSLDRLDVRYCANMVSRRVEKRNPSARAKKLLIM